MLSSIALAVMSPEDKEPVKGVDEDVLLYCRESSSDSSCPLSSSSSSNSLDIQLQSACTIDTRDTTSQALGVADYEQALESDKANVWHHMTNHKTASRAPLMIVRGAGLRVWDHRGNEYLDATSGG